MNIVVLDGYTTNPGDLSWEWLNKLGQAKIYDRTPDELIIPRASNCEIIITNKTPLTAEILAQLPKLKYIGLLSTGYNIVDCAEAKKRGIPVSNIPAYSTNAVAQLVFAMILTLTNQVSIHSNAVHNEEWSSCSDFCFTKVSLMELNQKKIGIIGYGSIGQKVAKIADAFGMNILISTPHPKQLPSPKGTQWLTTDELLANADIVTLHCPLTPKTQGMVTIDFLKKMKSNAFLINTSRGAVVDEQALAYALKQGIIAGAGLDVLNKEPPEKENPLFGIQNCIITPHIAWAAKETRQRLMNIAKENLTSFIAGKPIHIVNP